jgi:fatty acyl-CoA reductase
LNKLVAIQGDITIPGLGISETDLNSLISDVSIVFHSAATVKFDEPLK